MGHETTRIEIAVARWFGYRRNLIVPNVSWGFNIHECDLLVITKAGYALEIEIKVSKNDLLKDFKKTHSHKSNKIKRLFFAVPTKMEKHIPLIPERAGIIIVDSSGRCKLRRLAQANREARKLNEIELFKLAHLGAMRIWYLKNKILDLQKTLI